MFGFRLIGSHSTPTVEDDLRRSIGSRITVSGSANVDRAYHTAQEVVETSREGDMVTTCQAFDGLLENLLCDFKDSASKRDVKAAVPSTENPSRPRRVNDNVFPIAIVSELLTREHVRINPRYLPHWDAFTARYGQAVMAA